MRGSRACRNSPNVCERWKSQSSGKQAAGVDVPAKWNPAKPSFAGRLIVVGGQCSKVGKTALVTDLVSSLRDFKWTAVKITPYAESGCPVKGRGCDCSPNEHSVAIREESDPRTATDTSRFLAAGARRAFWVQAKAGQFGAALGDLVATLQGASHVVIESNAILEFWRPAGFIMVLDPSNPDFKPLTRARLSFADAFVLRSPLAVAKTANAADPDVPNKPIFLQPFGAPFPKGVQELARQLLDRGEHPSGDGQTGHSTGFRG